MGGNRRYAVTGISEAASVRTSVNLFSAGTAKPEVYDIIVGCSGTAADGVRVIKVWRSTAVGTEAAGVTPRKLDPDAPVSLCDAGETHSIEPTYTASSELLEIVLNQRATFRWVAAPGSALVGAGTANNGIGIQQTGVALAYESTMLFQE